MTKNTSNPVPKKKSVKRGGRRPVDILVHDCLLLAQRLETLAFTTHAQQRATRESMDAIGPVSPKHDARTRRIIDDLERAHSFALETSCECARLAEHIRRVALVVHKNVDAMIASQRAATDADPGDF